MRFRLPNKSGLVCPGYAGLDALLCIGRRMRLAALELCPCCLSSLRGQRTIRIKPSSVLNAVAITRGRERERERQSDREKERGEKQLYPACTHALMNLHGIYRCVLAVIVTNLGGRGRAQGGQRSSSSLNIRALGGNGSASTFPPPSYPVACEYVCLSVFPFKKPQKWADSAIVRCLHALTHTQAHMYLCACVCVFVHIRIAEAKYTRLLPNPHLSQCRTWA